MKSKKLLIYIFIIIFVLSLGTFGYIYYKTQQSKEEIPENKPEPVETIDTFSYELEDRDTELFKSVFEEMKNILNEEIIDYTKYAELLTKLYIIDLYTINNKISKYDVGGGDYVYPTSRDNFELKVRDTIYKYVEDNSNNTRKQNLPEVKSIEVEELETIEYKLGEEKYNGYKANVKWEYTNEIVYDTHAIVYLIKDKDKLYIVEQKLS